MAVIFNGKGIQTLQNSDRTKKEIHKFVLNERNIVSKKNVDQVA